MTNDFRYGNHSLMFTSSKNRRHAALKSADRAAPSRRLCRPGHAVRSAGGFELDTPGGTAPQAGTFR
ncbi:hypothetical protein IG197_05380 [Aminobacter sp. SR38]|uniref:hypothetical protein n=1 Tax=Aminobacter sp. SR38 TaxID=2774562 RepID=UPI001782AD74|nr:hypothetical protein [Aminobacter sp. SR38]QOF72511.1 hypothetical protein IG197_05380 [Aminobacter sp. SR38]